MLLCACAHSVKSEISQVRSFAWHRLQQRKPHSWSCWEQQKSRSKKS